MNRSMLPRIRLQTILSQRRDHHGLPLPAGHLQVEQGGARLFSAISSNWRGQRLVSHEVMVNLIAGTTTRTGLTVHAERDTGYYPTAVKVTAAERASVPLTGHTFHPSGTTPSARARKNPSPYLRASYFLALLNQV
jgi:hypothetical protein